MGINLVARMWETLAVFKKVVHIMVFKHCDRKVEHLSSLLLLL
jgi:hypothetical protein